MRLVTPEIESLQPYEAGKPIEEVARELGIEDAIKLASNENPLGPSPKALDAVRAALTSAHRYPDASAYYLREALAEFLSVKPQEIIHGNGSNEILELIIRTFTTREDHVVFGEPAFVVYKLAALAHGVPFTAVPLKNLTHDLEAMADAVTDKTRVLFVANPNNPTGTHVGGEAVRKLLERVPDSVIVVLDEAYIEYVEADDYVDALKLRDLHPRLMTTRTFSKAYGLASFRVGYAVGPAELIGYMNRVRAPFNVGALSQTAAIAALGDQDHVERTVELNSKERKRLRPLLEEAGLKLAPSQTNFFFASAGAPGRVLYDKLLRRGVIVRPMGTSDWVRITIGTPAENEKLLAALKEVLS